jgi:hypothetical protein
MKSDLKKKYCHLRTRYRSWYWLMQYETDFSWMNKYYVGLEDIFLEFLEWIAPFALCLCCFHEATDDQCMKPEHRYCWKCHHPMPYAEVSEKY